YSEYQAHGLELTKTTTRNPNLRSYSSFSASNSAARSAPRPACSARESADSRSGRSPIRGWAFSVATLWSSLSPTTSPRAAAMGSSCGPVAASSMARGDDGSNSSPCSGTAVGGDRERTEQQGDVIVAAFGQGKVEAHAPEDVAAGAEVVPGPEDEAVDDGLPGGGQVGRATGWAGAARSDWGAP